MGQVTTPQVVLGQIVFGHTTCVSPHHLLSGTSSSVTGDMAGRSHTGMHQTGHATDFIETFLFISAWNLGQCEGNFSVLSLTPDPESGENSTRGHCGIYFCAKENLTRVKKTSCVSVSSEMGLIIQKHGK